MSSSCLPGEMASAPIATQAPAVASAGRSTHVLSEIVNDGVVATSSVLLIGSFFWVGVLRMLGAVDFTGAKKKRSAVVCMYVHVLPPPQMQTRIAPHLGS